jgi:hypothetical protein
VLQRSILAGWRGGRAGAIWRALAAGVLAAAAALTAAAPAGANHSWGNYHWARTSNPFTLELGDNVSDNGSGAWDRYLVEASADWTNSSVLNTVIRAGQANPRNCRPTSGRVEVCNAAYGANGWLGIAQIWISGSHITQGTVRVNDTYFNTATYNTPAWRRLVMCQEVAHTFGLDHQDENFDNPNLGTCMDYTRDPDGPPSNEHPNRHDYDQLEAIYAHLDSTTTVGQSTGGPGVGQNSDIDPGDTPAAWGEPVRRQPDGRPNVYARDLGGGRRLVTHVFWAEPGAGPAAAPAPPARRP